MTKPIIPIFFATDDNYAPYLGVAISSLIKNASQDYFYKIHVLTTSLSPSNRRKLSACIKKSSAELSFVNVSDKVSGILHRLHLRDYYSSATYYRFFIADLFPQYQKALYLDCDIIINGDVSELYNTPLGSNLLGAVEEEVMQKITVFGDYVEKVLELPRASYFNAGVLVMNLAEFRHRDVLGQFVELLGKRRFDVTQDQDYLNVIAYGSTVLIGLEWNKTPIPDESFDDRSPLLVHYKINWKPWHYDGVLYGDDFWEYALKSKYRRQLLKESRDYTDEQRDRDSLAYNNLYKLAQSQIRDAASTVLMNA